MNTVSPRSLQGRRVRWASCWHGAVAIALATWAGLASADPYVGTQVSGSAQDYSLICGTCPIESNDLYAGTDGGTGVAQAVLAGAGAGWALSGSASLSGPDALPVLGAFAFADIVLDPSNPKTWFHQATATAEATQHYSYSGSTPQVYRIDYTLDGSFVLAANDPVSLMSVVGGLTVYGNDYNPVGELHGTVLDTSFVNDNAALAGTQPFSLSGSVSFTLAPGDGFYVWSLLSVYADSSHEVVGSVDAAHSLRLQFAEGDASLLTPALAAVPEPTGAALLIVGLVCLAARHAAHSGSRRAG